MRFFPSLALAAALGLAALSGITQSAQAAQPTGKVFSKGMSAKGKSAQAARTGKRSKVARSTKSKGGRSGASSGIASWYGGKFHGRKTASGETYNQNSLTAAHRTLPFGTRVRVTNTRNGDAVVVRINDRGPFIAGRVIDLSRAAANSIGINGLGQVKLTVLGRN